MFCSRLANSNLPYGYGSKCSSSNLIPARNDILVVALVLYHVSEPYMFGRPRISRGSSNLRKIHKIGQDELRATHLEALFLLTWSQNSFLPACVILLFKNTRAFLSLYIIYLATVNYMSKCQINTYHFVNLWTSPVDSSAFGMADAEVRSGFDQQPKIFNPLNMTNRSMSQGHARAVC